MNIELSQPYSNEAEQAVLGSLLIDADAYYDVADIITSEMFYRPQHRTMYEAIARLVSRDDPVDILTVPAEMGNGSPEVVDYILTLINAVPSSIHAEAYARIVADKAARRRLIDAAGKIATAAYQADDSTVNVFAEAEAQLAAAMNGAAGNPVRSPQAYVSDYVDRFMENSDGPRVIQGVATGYLDLDNVIGQLDAPYQYVLAGRPGMGKSSLALGIVKNAILRQGKRVLLFSLEMSTNEVTQRLIAMMTGLTSRQLRREWELTNAQRAAVLDAGGRLSEAGLFIDPSGELTPGELRRRAMRVQMEHGLDMIVVDHMHLMKPDRSLGNNVLEVSETATSLAATYKQLNVAGLTLAQLSRTVESRAIKLPSLSDLRGSGGIEETAYSVMFLYREDYYDDTAPHGPAKLAIAKNRGGPTGIIDLFWKANLSMYVNAMTVDLNARSNGRVAKPVQEVIL